MKKIILGSLILILFVSGCTDLPFDIPFLTGGDKVNITKMGPDVITIENINLIPKSTIRPDDRFSIFYEVKNQAEDEMIGTVSYELYDTGLCNLTGGNPSDFVRQGNSASYNWLGGFAPSETKLVEWDFTAPSDVQIAHLNTKCPIRFLVKYTYNSTSQIDVRLIDEGRLIDMQRTGKDISYVPSLSIGRGPVKIYFDFGGSLPARNGIVLPVYVKVVDEGNGLFSEVPATAGKSLTISAPGFKSIKCISDYFSCDTNNCSNSKSIPLIKKQTFDLRCELTTPDTVSMEKTEYITAQILNYVYDVQGEVIVEVKPNIQ